MKNNIRIFMTLGIILLVSCGEAGSGSAVSTGTSKNQDFQVSDVILEKSEENKLLTRWTAPVKAARVDYYLVELRSADTVITRRASAGETELKIAVPSGSYRTSVAVVAEGTVEPGVPGDKELSVETKATAPGDVGMTVVDLSTVITSAEHASIEAGWRAPLEVGKVHEGGTAEPEVYILYWKKGARVGTIDYDGTKKVTKDVATGALTTNAVIEALTAGSDYAIRVVVENTAGLRSEGVELTIKTAVSQATAPAPPVIQEQSIVSIGTASDATLSFSWTAPASPGTDYKGDRAAIKRYRIYWEQGASVSAVSGTPLTLLKDATSASISGLKNVTEYTFMVVVETSGGLSAESAVQSYITAAKTQAEAPAAVSNFEVTASEDELEITLQWDAHTGTANGKNTNGESAHFKAYHLYWVAGTEAVFTGDANAQVVTHTTTTHNITKDSLKGGTDYIISIVVENSEGLRSNAESRQAQIRDFASAPSDITPTLNPTVIEHMKAEIEVRWIVPEDTGRDSNNEQAQIEKYILTWIEGIVIPKGKGTTQELAADAELSLILVDLDPGKDYTVAVVARNTAGLEGTAVEVTISIPASQESDPEAPVLNEESIDTQSTSTEARITVNWTKPNAGRAANGDEASIDGYALYWKENSESVSLDDYTGKQEVEGTATSSIIQRLTVSTRYALLLVVRSSNGREAQSNVAIKNTGEASTAVAPGMVTQLAVTQVEEDAVRTTALKLSWNAPSSFGKDEAGEDSTLNKYLIYLQASSELGAGEPVDVSGKTDYMTTDTEYTIPAEALEGGTKYRLAVVVMNSEGAVSEAAEVEETPYDLSEAPGAVVQVYVDSSHMEPNEIRIYWTPVSGKDRNGKAVAAVYQIYKGESSNGYVDAQDLITRVGMPHATGISTTETVDETLRVAHTIKELTPNIEYDIVVIAEHSENAELKSAPMLKARVLSTGISQFTLFQGQDSLPEDAKVNMEVGEKLTLKVEMASYNVLTEIRWVSANTEIATVVAHSTGTATADLTAQSVGEVKIRATSKVDSTKFAEVTIIVSRVDISETTLSYVDNVYTQKGEGTTINIRSTTIPDGANIGYALKPPIAGITIEYVSGIITVGEDLEEGTYEFTVEATVIETDAFYTGIVTSNQIALKVQESNIVYKPISVESRKIFSTGDADNPWLFVVRNLDLETGASAAITITDQKDSSVILHEQSDITVNSFEHEGETVVGFGPSVSASSWATFTADVLRIEVIVYVNDEEIDRLILDLTRGREGDIYSWRDLQKMDDDLTRDYVMQNDIAFPAVETYGFPATGFVPIGRDITTGNDGHQGTAFSGSLDGGGYSISGMVVNDVELDYGGLFGKIEASAATTEVVKDLIIEDPHINVNAMAGVVVGYLHTGMIARVAVRSTADTSGVWTDGNVVEADIYSSSENYIGGLVGALGAGKVLQCLSEVSVTGTGNYAGGLVGYNNSVGNVGTVTGYTEGTVSGDSYVGGLVGYSSTVGTVTGYAMGMVSGNNYIGGLVGYSDKTGLITGYAVGAVSGNNYIGGLVGKNNAGTVTGYTTGTVSGNSHVGGLVGMNYESDTVTGYVRGTVERSGGSDTRYGLLVGTGTGTGYSSLAESSFVGIDEDAVTGSSGVSLPMKEETSEEAFTLLDFTDGPWRWVADGKWPAIDIGVIKPKEEQPTERSDSEFPEGMCMSTEDNKPEYSGGFYQIDSWQELQWMENCLYESYKLTDNIVIPEPGQEGMSQAGFKPVGLNSEAPFTGHFDGGGYSISGFSIARSGSDYVGLFGYVYGGRVENLHLEHSGIEGNNYVGTVVGYAVHARIVGVSIESTEAVSGNSYAGGLVGRNIDGIVVGYAAGTVSGNSYVGGLVGENSDKSTVTGYVTGAVSGDRYVGGLVGKNSRSTVIGYATGTVFGEQSVGGLVGNNESAGKIGGYVRGNVERSGSAYNSFGLLVGDGAMHHLINGYYSLAESFFVGIDKDAASGFSGIPLAMKEDTIKDAFTALDFMDGSWYWVADGQWPAIDLGTNNPINEQPTMRSDNEFPEDLCDTAEVNRPEYSDEIYQIDSWQELQWMENCLYANYKLIADITIPAPGQEDVPQAGFRPIGMSSENSFSGHFDGGGYSISGLSIARSESDYVGLFGYVYGGRIENLRIEHSGIEGNNYVGAVAGYAKHARVEGISMESAGTVSGNSYVGGLTGQNISGSIIGYAKGAVSGEYNVGGLVGQSYEGTVIGYATETVSAVGNVGGLVGQNNYTSISKVIGYATGMVSGSNRGGLVGFNLGTAVGYWNQETTNVGTAGIGISGTANIYYYTGETESSGREKNKYYDKGTGIDNSKPDSKDTQIFNNEDFTLIFELSETSGFWPKLKQSFIIDGRDITLTNAIYDAQQDVVGW